MIRSTKFVKYSNFSRNFDIKVVNFRHHFVRKAWTQQILIKIFGTEISLSAKFELSSKKYDMFYKIKLKKKFGHTLRKIFTITNKNCIFRVDFFDTNFCANLDKIWLSLLNLTFRGTFSTQIF